MEEFCIASFRSRTYVLRFESLLRLNGISCSVVSTPRQVALGCGLSVSFSCMELGKVKSLLYSIPTFSFLGFYRVKGGRTVSPC